jgi:ABC-type branched-subunit amino acid transport system substrate-binding protein
MAFFGFSPTVFAQSVATESKPYAKLDRERVTYRGPANANEKEMPDSAATIGIILPLSGPGQSEGKALLAAARIALDEEQALNDGHRLALVARDENGPWGQASSEILKLVEQDHVLAVLTSANGNTAHLADQLANKISFPILTLASDPTTTEANVPWLFRLGPSDTDQARAFCRRIYEELRLRNVLVITQADHDGRIGGGEFEKEARALKTNQPDRLEINAATQNLEAIRATIRAKNPDAIVVWTDAVVGNGLIPVIRKEVGSTPIFVCRKAAESTFQSMSGAGLFAVGSIRAQGVELSKFEQAYYDRTGRPAGMNAVEMYEAVRLAAAGLRCVGENRVLLREYFATSRKSGNAVEGISFDPAGNRAQELVVVEMNSQPVIASHR